MRDTISVRANEREQIREYLPKLITTYEDSELDDRAELLKMMEYHFVHNDDETVEFGPDSWSLLTTALNELDGQRPKWLAAKIARRAELDVVSMGFTTSVPLMTTVTGEKPTRPT